MKTPNILQAIVALTTLGLVSAAGADEIPLSTLLELVRTDLKVEKVAIVSEVMELSDGEAEAFWDVYRKYDARMNRYWDARFALIERYAQSFDNLTDETVEELADEAARLESTRHGVKLEFFGRMRSATSTQTALRFFQLENQLQAVADFQLSSGLPFVPKRPSAE